jgi:AmmeMemoRadiSam system protein B
MNKIKFILIPHAGKKYAGDCRNKVFNKIKNIENIIYITALHNSLYLKENLKNKNFIIKDECKLFIQNNKKNFIKNNNIIKNEHSYEWVKNELNVKFKNAKHTVITPGPNIKLEDYKQLIKLINKNNLNKNTTLIISTTDLIHYGKNYNMFDLKKPVQNSKMYEESKFINSIINLDLNEINNLYKKKPYLCCGINSIKILVYLILNINKNLKGEVCDYYDSVQSKYNKNSIKRYSNDFENKIENFVSYVSIIYKINNKIKITNLDKNIALGCLRNILIKNIIGKIIKNDFKYYIPEWSNFNKINNGIFVGTNINKTIKCSTGRFENNNNNISSAIKIYLSSKNCYNDSNNRWGGLNKEHIFKINYKIELLDKKNTWKNVELKILQDKEEDFKNYGFYIEFDKNNINYSATYLPNVWKESLPDNNIIEMLNKLSLKASNNQYKLNNNIKNLKIFIYKSEKYNKNF